MPKKQTKKGVKKGITAVNFQKAWYQFTCPKTVIG